MGTSKNNQQSFTAALKALLLMEYESLDGYEAAIHYLQSSDYKNTLTRFQADHQRHVEDLTQLLEKHEEGLPSRDTQKAFLPKSKRSIAHLEGDQKILLAMQSNENEVLEAYEHIQEQASSLEDSKAILIRALKDEKKHSAWIEKTIGSFSSK